jgi:hypothetical protein
MICSVVIRGNNDSGLYRFDAVDLGVYKLEVAHPGFQSFRGAGIKVEANRTTTFDPRLEVGAAETRIEVSAESSEMLVKDSHLRGGNFQPREVRDLPLPLLNPLSLARTLPGATEAAGSTVTSGVATNGAQFSINGQRPRANNFMLDGTENNEVWLTGEEQVFTNCRRLIPSTTKWSWKTIKCGFCGSNTALTTNPCYTGTRMESQFS